MKLMVFNDNRVGVLKGENVVDITAVISAIPHTGPGNLMSGLIARWADCRGAIDQAVAAGAGTPVSQVTIHPPLPKPVNIDCMAVNYMEDGTRTEPAPINAFHKSPGCIIGHGATMVLPDMPASVFEGEAELALVIGKPASHVPAARAMEYVFGYMNFIDGSARGVQPAAQSFYQMKSRDTFAPIGPWIVTADEIPDPQNLQVRLWNNGVLKQNYNTSDMAHNIGRSLEFVTSIHALAPGDILALGTNHRGLHALQHGDKLELEVEGGLGRLKIRIKDKLKRAWPRETRLERQDKGEEALAVQSGGKYAKV